MQPSKVRIRNNAWYDKLRAFLTELKWDRIRNQKDAEKMFDSFNNTIVSI